MRNVFACLYMGKKRRQCWNKWWTILLKSDTTCSSMEINTQLNMIIWFIPCCNLKDWRSCGIKEVILNLINHNKIDENVMAPKKQIETFFGQITFTHISQLILPSNYNPDFATTRQKIFSINIAFFLRFPTAKNVQRVICVNW